ncbi:hypothetical protein [Pseudomonas asplenii]|uniref:Methyl-accepting chemotaxis protein n=1 Tax=Pseudomonas asplenii TaxID=53407 RepID=A0A1H6P285_9PSED|nr:hypothetical protein [Pseudomonas fuscovaginae]SEI23565.1 methyl-accepting chemotaxis protein [Pseudomonas fuscovaginae]
MTRSSPTSSTSWLPITLCGFGCAVLFWLASRFPSPAWILAASVPTGLLWLRSAPSPAREQAQDRAEHEKLDNAAGVEVQQEVQGLSALCQRIAPIWSAQIESARHQSQSAVEALSERFAHLSELLAAAISPEVAADSDSTACLLARHKVELEIAQVLVALQFQDRVSQMLGHVRDDIARLARHLDEGDARHVDTRAWLDELSRTYTTPEQHAIHRGRHGVRDSASDITFF